MHSLNNIDGKRLRTERVEDSPQGLKKGVVEIKNERGEWIQKYGNDGISTFFPED